MYIERAVKDTNAKIWSTEVVGILDINALQSRDFLTT